MLVGQMAPHRITSCSVQYAATVVEGADGRSIPLPKPQLVAPRPLLALPPEAPEGFSRGQVWRLRWDHTTLMALIWNVHDNYLEVLPVTPEIQMADDSTVRLTADVTNGLGPVAVWVGLEAPVEFCVLDTYWGEIELEDVAVVRRCARLGKPMDELQVSVGSSITNAFDERYEYRAAVSEDMDAFRGASWVAKSGNMSLQDLITRAGVAMAEVMVAIGQPSTERLRILRGQRPFTPEEAQLLAPVLDSEPADVLAVNPALDPDLVSEMNLPRWKPHIIAASEDLSLSEADTRSRNCVPSLRHGCATDGLRKQTVDVARKIETILCRRSKRPQLMIRKFAKELELRVEAITPGCLSGIAAILWRGWLAGLVLIWFWFPIDR